MEQPPSPAESLLLADGTSRSLSDLSLPSWAGRTLTSYEADCELSLLYTQSPPRKTQRTTSPDSSPSIDNNEGFISKPKGIDPADAIGYPDGDQPFSTLLLRTPSPPALPGQRGFIDGSIPAAAAAGGSGNTRHTIDFSGKRPAAHASYDLQAACARTEGHYGLYKQQLRLQVGDQIFLVFCYAVRGWLLTEVANGMIAVTFRRNEAPGRRGWKGSRVTRLDYGAAKVEEDFRSATGLQRRPRMHDRQVTPVFGAALSLLLRQELQEHFPAVDWPEDYRLDNIEYGGAKRPINLYINGIYSVAERVVRSFRRGRDQNRAVLAAARQIQLRNWKRAIDIFSSVEKVAPDF